MNDIEELLQQVGNAVEVILAEDEAGSSDHGAEEPNDPPDQEVEVEVDLEWENGNKIIDEGMFTFNCRSQAIHKFIKLSNIS